VPAHVQMEGWGVPAYNNSQYPWDGTEDLKPYIPKKTLIIKWMTVVVGNPVIAAALAGIMMLFVK